MTPEDVVMELDRIARDYDRYEYGLPTDADNMVRLAAVVGKASREAVAAAVERCAKVAEDAAAHHRDHCPPECRCADGWHIAARIRNGS